MIMKALLVLLLDLLVCFLLGMLINKRILRRQTNIIESTLIGFFGYQILCQLMTLGCYFTTGIVHQLSYAWAAIVVVISVIAAVWCRKDLCMEMQRVKKRMAEAKLFSFLMTAAVLAFCYYTAINGETNADSQYYIALVNTTAATDTLYRYNPYNGYESDAFFLRRALATFECHSAILCRLFDIHALVITRIVRAVQNVLLTTGAVYLWGQEIFGQEEKKKHAKSCLLVVIFLILQPVFSCNYYTNAAFFLQRAYEGKSFTANVVLLFVLYISYQFAKSRKWAAFLLLGIIWWGSIALSSSAIFLVPAASVLVIVPYWIAAKAAE